MAALEHGPAELITTARYVMGWEDTSGMPSSGGGKRIRPALCLFAAELFAADPNVAMPGAVAVELIHNFSLVHDEVQDHDAERHHRPTIWALKGEGQAINAGDFLIARALDALINGDGPSERRMAALSVLNGAMARMIAGQWDDISFESRTTVSPEEYLDMVRGKTGALLGAPLAMGALLAGASNDEATRLQEWGETVGLAFQVQDDYLGIWGDPNLTGKSNTNDIARKKKTLPVVHGLSSPGAAKLAALYEQETLNDDDVQAAVDVLEAVKSDAFTKAEGARLVSRANDLLADFELSLESLGHLRAVGAYLIDRDS